MTDKIETVAWDSCIIIDAVQKCPDIWQQIEPYVQRGEAGNLHVVISELSVVECSHLKKSAEPLGEQQRLLDMWFDSPYVVRRPITPKITKLAVGLTRNHITLKGSDAIIMATALIDGIPILHTKDDGLMRLSGSEGSPPMIIARPDPAYGTLFSTKRDVP